MRRGPIPLNAHVSLAPLMAILIVASLWIFGFAIELLTALGTRWEHEGADSWVGHAHPAA